MNSPGMNPSVATPAKGNQVIQRIVSQPTLCCRSFSVDMVNVKIVLCAAILASAIVSLQSLFAVPVEIVVISGALGVFSNLVTVGFQPITDFVDLFDPLAFGASLLWAGAVFKIIAAFGAKQNRANFDSATFPPQIAKGLGILLGAVSRHTTLASPLVAPCRFVSAAANNAIAHFKAASGLPMSGKRTEFASLHIWRCSDNLLRAIWASDRSVNLHFSTPINFFRNIAGSRNNG
jgi:hypothetical protein